MTGTILEFIILLITHAAAGIYSSTLKYSKKKTYIIWGIWIALQTGLLFYTEYVLTNFTLQFVVGFIISLIGQYAIFFATTKGKLAQRVFMMLTYSVFFCIAMTFIMAVKESFSELHWAIKLFIHGAILFAMVGYFLKYVCSLCRSASKNITTGWTPLIFVNIVFLITVIFSSVFPVRPTGFDDPVFITFVLISISILSVYPIIFSSINSLSEASMKREVEAQNKLLLAQIEAENIQLLADSRARHDRRHHDLVMLEFANNNDIESVREYLKNLVESENTVGGEIRYCDNMTANTVLTAYERKAKEKGIFVKISANVSRDIEIPPQDIVIVIANLFENAINATAKLKNNNKKIEISIKENAKRLLIKMENPCKGNFVFDESCFGIGISSVIETAKKYDGMYDFSAENGTFSAKVSLNISR